MFQVLKQIRRRCNDAVCQNELNERLERVDVTTTMYEQLQAELMLLAASEYPDPPPKIRRNIL
jgi:hypothetical protein